MMVRRRRSAALRPAAALMMGPIFASLRVFGFGRRRSLGCPEVRVRCQKNGGIFGDNLGLWRRKMAKIAGKYLSRQKRAGTLLPDHEAAD